MRSEKGDNVLQEAEQLSVCDKIRADGFIDEKQVSEDPQTASGLFALHKNQLLQLADYRHTKRKGRRSEEKFFPIAHVAERDCHHGNEVGPHHLSRLQPCAVSIVEQLRANFV